LFYFQQTKIDASSDEGDKPQTITGDIEFNNITFTYPSRQEAPVCFFMEFSNQYLSIQ
jgi:ABC-type multidrug transport system fused ATPase/permease subunit